MLLNNRDEIFPDTPVVFLVFDRSEVADIELGPNVTGVWGRKICDDVQTDPLEINNLATSGRQHRELTLAMNEKLNRLIATEVGEDRGQMLPGGIEAGWEVTPVTMAP